MLVTTALGGPPVGQLIRLEVPSVFVPAYTEPLVLHAHVVGVTEFPDSHIAALHLKLYGIGRGAEQAWQRVVNGSERSAALHARGSR